MMNIFKKAKNGRQKSEMHKKCKQKGKEWKHMQNMNNNKNQKRTNVL